MNGQSTLPVYGTLCDLAQTPVFHTDRGTGLYAASSSTGSIKQGIPYVRGLHNTDSSGPGKISPLFYRVCELRGLHNIGYEGHGAFMINTYSTIDLHNIYDRLVRGRRRITI